MLLVGVLIFAVMRTSDDSSEPPDSFIHADEQCDVEHLYDVVDDDHLHNPEPANQRPEPAVRRVVDIRHRSPTTTTEDTPEPGTVTETATLLPPPP